MRVAIVKPEFGIIGGFEVVVARLTAELRDLGYDVEFLLVDGLTRARHVFGVNVSQPMWDAHPAYFRYVSQVEAFLALDARRHDVVISTQPPSFAVRHPRHISIFYHHERFFYDLADVFVDAGFIDRAVHERAVEAVRRIDGSQLGNVTTFLAGSDEVRRRLASFNGISSNVALLYAGLDRRPARFALPRRPGHVLCVGRMEFPKRAELVVHAMKYLPELRAVIAGGGARLEWTRALDARLSNGDVDLDAVTDADLWLNTGGPADADAHAATNVSIPGRVSRAELEGLFLTASCVVAPAYREDYGLTALEAMARRRPVIVCDDGGGLVELVEDGVTGLVVPPRGRDIAAAIRRIADEPELAAQLGAAGAEFARAFTWERATRQLLDGIDAVAA